ncbi:uncharacterized protein PG986_004617 [Apiospora aurea]|uniref:Cation-transporting P-type ATPase N-terminal domain-containing protein n=1 Tax=Apiospora aurea TaxID=335848 RepID=A0ABR1QN32_9PEZI
MIATFVGGYTSPACVIKWTDTSHVYTDRSMRHTYLGMAFGVMAWEDPMWAQGGVPNECLTPEAFPPCPNSYPRFLESENPDLPKRNGRLQSAGYIVKVPQKAFAAGRCGQFQTGNVASIYTEFGRIDQHKTSIADIDVDAATGLDPGHAAERLEEHCPNRLSASLNRWAWKILGHRFKCFGSILLIGGVL